MRKIAAYSGVILAGFTFFLLSVFIRHERPAGADENSPVILAQEISTDQDFSEVLSSIIFDPDITESSETTDDSPSRGPEISITPSASTNNTTAASPSRNPGAQNLFLSFEEQYPEYYRAALEKWQDAVIERSNYIEQGSRYAFQTEADIIAFLDTFIAFNTGAGILTKIEGAAARDNLYNSFLPMKRRERVSAFLERFFALFLPETAHAQFGSFITGLSSRWVTAPPLCYKNTGAASPGIVLFSPTCNAGLKLIPTTPPTPPIPIPDCGPFSSLCTTPLGCLNAVCIRHPNSIYNRLTNHCGCG
ncbi:MAG: hypothetical protein HYS59_00950 [Candidatus Vogelbacteria bacterium]|nr:hypothetical protein [Candidatus Vogelbacteria bacterium]